MFKKINQEDAEDIEEEKLEDKAQELLNDAVHFVVNDIEQELHKVESLVRDKPVLEEIIDIVRLDEGKGEFVMFNEAVDVIRKYAKRILFGGE